MSQKLTSQSLKFDCGVGTFSKLDICFFFKFGYFLNRICTRHQPSRVEPS
jgi:hypothetical protein